MKRVKNCTLDLVIGLWIIIWVVLAAFAFCETGEAQTVMQSGVAFGNVNNAATLIPNGTVQICTTPTSSAPPCNTPATIFQVLSTGVCGSTAVTTGLTMTDNNGLYNFCAAAGTYALEVSSNFFAPIRSYVTVGGAGSGAPGAPLYSIQSNSPLGTFAGDANFLWEPGTYTNCPSCLWATPTDLTTWGGNFNVTAFGAGGISPLSETNQGGEINLIANSPQTNTETAAGGSGTILLQANTNSSGDGAVNGAVTVRADTYSATTTSAYRANIALVTCHSGNTTAGYSCQVTIFANGASDLGDYSGVLTLDAQGNGGPNSGAIDIGGSAAYTDIWPDTTLHGTATIYQESSYAGYGACYTTGGLMGHCTSVLSSSGTCTCVSP